MPPIAVIKALMQGITMASNHLPSSVQQDSKSDKDCNVLNPDELDDSDAPTPGTRAVFSQNSRYLYVTVRKWKYIADIQPNADDEDGGDGDITQNPRSCALGYNSCHY